MNKSYDYYCLTIRKCTSAKTYKQAERVLKDYDYYINNLDKSIDIEDISSHYEVKMNLKKQFNIHVHCTIKVTKDKQVYVSPKKGWSLRLELCKSLKRWSSYVGKQRISRSDILLYVKRNLDPPEILPTNAPSEADQLAASEHFASLITPECRQEMYEDYIEDASNYDEPIRK